MKNPYYGVNVYSPLAFLAVHFLKIQAESNQQDPLSSKWGSNDITTVVLISLINMPIS